MKNLDKFWFHWTGVVLDDPKQWHKEKKGQIKGVWLWTKVLAASAVIIPILESKDFFERRKRKKKGGAR